ncbi:MAG: DNA gyrase inhibitor YacG [Deltaproteobacteria bacterium]|nr:DNA gyrase inhibitor YacG [Deltaproteobacteria bacterium]
MTEKKIKCPVCKKETVWKGNAFRPFCSERCSLVDLGKWADGKYSVETGEGEEDREEGKEHEPR